METFVVRIFVPTGGDRLELSGIVEHPASGRNLQFRGANGLLDAVRGELSLAEDSGSSYVDPENGRHQPNLSPED